MLVDDLKAILLGIDEEASLVYDTSQPRPCVVIVGGAAFLLRDLTARNTTHDIDVFMADSAMREIMANYPGVNGDVAAFIDQIPYNFEDRLVPLDIESETVDFVTPSTEDLVVMKLYAERPNDLQDIESAANKGMVDWDLLEKLVYDKDEAAASSLSERRYNEMVASYERFKARCKQDESDVQGFSEFVLPRTHGPRH